MPLKFEEKSEIIIREIKSFQHFEEHDHSLKNCTILGLDFSKERIDWSTLEIKNTTFLGCKLSFEDIVTLTKMGARIYQAPDSLPYNPFRSSLYVWQELEKPIEGVSQATVDLQIYRHFSINKFNPSINEALWQRIHDYSMDEALRDLLQYDTHGMTRLKCVGFMGGHSTLRTDPFYAITAACAKLLAENGFYIVSGGGPGIMEATNLGAYMAGKSKEALQQAIEILSIAPKYTDADYQTQARKVLALFPEGQDSLAIPTWFYGHEPSNFFATHIAKYFSNSIREDTLLAISLYGIICAPGSAGTTQEIFMDATQNHYGTFNYYSPMVFLGVQRYEIETLIYPLLKQLAWDRPYFNLLHLTDEPQDVLDFLKKHPPIPKVK